MKQCSLEKYFLPEKYRRLCPGQVPDSKYAEMAGLGYYKIIEQVWILETDISNLIVI